MKNRPTTSRIFGAIATIGALFGMNKKAMAVAADKTEAPTSGASVHDPLTFRMTGYGAAPDVWGQSSACRRMVYKNRMARRALA